MTPATLTLTKYFMQFTGDDGKEVKFDYVDIEFAPNLFSRFKLTPNNARCMERYNPNLYQFICNLPYGSTAVFCEQRVSADQIRKAKTIEGIYSNSENEL